MATIWCNGQIIVTFNLYKDKPHLSEVQTTTNRWKDCRMVILFITITNDTKIYLIKDIWVLLMYNRSIQHKGKYKLSTYFIHTWFKSKYWLHTAHKFLWNNTVQRNWMHTVTSTPPNICFLKAIWTRQLISYLSISYKLTEVSDCIILLIHNISDT